ncbi:MAG: energy-coupling factor transporter transmembrane protein EcfT, partial [Huintestinicola sp.]
MLKDITIGQYFPMDSAVHKLDARFKIAITAVFIVMIFSADSFLSLSLALIFFVIAFAASKLSPKLILKSMKPIVPVIIFTSVLNIFFI